MRIKTLVVDDMRTIRFYERKLLEEMGYEVEEAEDGFEAISKMRIVKPHLVLLDIVMPRMNGIECCRRIKTEPALSSIKVIMVSSKNEYAGVDEAFKAGCDDYVIKPIQQGELIRKLNELSLFIRCRQHIDASKGHQWFGRF